MATYSKQYLDYLQSPEWSLRRLSKIEAAEHRCENCGETDYLEVHHLTYERLGRERDSDLKVLCKSCHWAADQKRKGNTSLWVRFNAPIKRTKKQIALAIKTLRKARLKQAKKNRRKRMADRRGKR